MKSSWITIIRWTARILGSLMVLFVLLFAIGSLLEGLGKKGPGLDAYTIIVFVVWGVGLAGLIVAWWNERLGVFISVAGIVIFNILAAVNPNPDASYTFVLLLFLIPSALYVLGWWLEGKVQLK
ncbi:MAG: hypothetical protein ACKOE6_11535 [Flammeovirgaceae bacterium]